MNSSTALTLLKGAAASALAWRALSSLSAPVPKLMRKKCVVLTGAANGVGKLTALLLAQRGAHLVLWDIQEDALADAVHWIREAVPQAQVVSFVCDLSSRAQIYEAAKRTKAECRSRWDSHVSVVINNAGIVSGASFLESDDWRNELTMRVNCNAHMWTAKAFLPDMIKEHDGHICSVASIASYVAAPGMVDYACSKAAARAFAEGLNRELKSIGATGVHVTCICPTHINTKLFKGFDNPGTTLKTEDVAAAIVTAIETNQELVVLPSSLKSLIVVKAMHDIFGRLGMPSALKESHNPMHKVDLSAANRVFERMGRAKL